MQSYDETSELAKTLQAVATDPWEFATRCVYTKDQVDMKMPTKKFPAHLDYLKIYFKIWEKRNLVAVPKSRRMYMSWANIILYLWDTMWHPGRHNAFVSKKEDDADDLCRRAKFVYDNIPEDVLPKQFLPKIKYKYCSLEFTDIDSRLQGFPQGADQLRSFTFSGILWDEVAFMDQAENSYAATLPTVEGGGRMTMVSSPGPGFFKKIVFDKLDE